MDFNKALDNFQSSLEQIKKQKTDLNKAFSEKVFYDFKEERQIYLVNQYKNSFKELKKSVFYLDNPKIHQLFSQLEDFYIDNKTDKMQEVLSIIKSETKYISVPKEEKLSFRITNIPEDIKSDINADLRELEKTFQAGCYRSAVVLCGRMLETALHRKYYEVTKLDILEKNPGIGLGTLVAKLKEKKVNFDPGITEQIHLINQVRIFSVHKKQEAFYPNKNQTQAIILYTLDTVQKLF